MAHTLSSGKENLSSVCEPPFGLHGADQGSQEGWFETRRKTELPEEVHRTFEGARGSACTRALQKPHIDTGTAGEGLTAVQQCKNRSDMETDMDRKHRAKVMQKEKKKKKNMQLAKTGKDRNVSKPFVECKKRHFSKGMDKWCWLP